MAMCTLSVVAVLLAPLVSEPPLHPILDPAFQLELNALSNSTLAVSEEMDLLVNGVESYPVRWRMLDEAKESIHFTTMYIFSDDTTKKFRDVLIAKRKAGIDVKMIVFGVYSHGNPLFYHRMKKNDIEVQKYSGVLDVLAHVYEPKRFWLRHLHDKYLVVDGEQVLTGGMNWSGRYERGGTGKDVAWRDTDIWLRGPQAAIVEKEFEKRWYVEEDPERSQRAAAELDAIYAAPIYPADRDYMDFLTPDPEVPGGWRVRNLTRFLYQQPYEQDRRAHMTAFYKAVMDRAQSHIWWESISIRPAEVQKTALLEAAARGVDVRLITNSKRNMCMIPIGGFPLYYITRAEYRDLLEGGVRIFEYSGDAPMHAKGFLVDDVVSVVGSYNATFTAEKYYTESGVAVYDTDVIRDVRQMLLDDMAESSEVTLADLDKRPKDRRRKPFPMR